MDIFTKNRFFYSKQNFGFGTITNNGNQNKTKKLTSISNNDKKENKISSENLNKHNLKFYSKDVQNKKINFKTNKSNKNNFIFNKDYITLDSFAFGMSNGCLQITFSSRNISEAREVYDSLSVLSGVLTPFSASTAVIDSTLIDWDLRLPIIEQCSDTRTKREFVIFYLF
jgi:hypothetical protein